MNIKFVSLTAALMTASMGSLATPMLDNEVYKHTQSTYNDDIDMINITFASLDRACRKNSPYGTAFKADSGMTPVANCAGINTVKHDAEGRKNQLSSEVMYFAQYTTNFFGQSQHDKTSLLTRIDTKFNKRNNAIKKVASRLYSKMLESQKIKGITSKNFKYSAPQVITVAGVYNSGHEREILRNAPVPQSQRFTPSKDYFKPFALNLYVTGLDALTGQKEFWKIDEDGSTQQIIENDFIKESGLFINPLYVVNKEG